MMRRRVRAVEKSRAFLSHSIPAYVSPSKPQKRAKRLSLSQSNMPPLHLKSAASSRALEVFVVVRVTEKEEKKSQSRLEVAEVATFKKKSKAQNQTSYSLHRLFESRWRHGDLHAPRVGGAGGLGDWWGRG